MTENDSETTRPLGDLRDFEGVKPEDFPNPQKRKLRKPSKAREILEETIKWIKGEVITKSQKSS